MFFVFMLLNCSTPEEYRRVEIQEVPVVREVAPKKEYEDEDSLYQTLETVLGKEEIDNLYRIGGQIIKDEEGNLDVVYDSYEKPVVGLYSQYSNREMYAVPPAVPPRNSITRPESRLSTISSDEPYDRPNGSNIIIGESDLNNPGITTEQEEAKLRISDKLRTLPRDLKRRLSRFLPTFSRKELTPEELRAEKERKKAELQFFTDPNGNLA